MLLLAIGEEKKILSYLAGVTSHYFLKKLLIHIMLEVII